MVVNLVVEVIKVHGQSFNKGTVCGRAMLVNNTLNHCQAHSQTELHLNRSIHVEIKRQTPFLGYLMLTKKDTQMASQSTANLLTPEHVPQLKPWSGCCSKRHTPFLPKTSKESSIVREQQANGYNQRFSDKIIKM